MAIATLQDLFVDELRDIYDAEKQLVKALPKLAKACSDSELRQTFTQHLDQTKEHVHRVEQIFEMCGTRARSKPCHGMKGIVEEGQEIIAEEIPNGLHDTAIIGAAERVEHYEIASYDTAKQLAQKLGMKDAANLIETTLKEEELVARRLSQITKRLLKAAGKPGPEGRAARVSTNGRNGKNGKKGRAAAANGKSEGRMRARGAGSRAPGGAREETGESHLTTDHEEIRRWVEERGGQPARVATTGGRQDPGLLRIDFPGTGAEQNLQPISWDEFFEKFDEKNLAFLFQESTARGKTSRFSKFVSRQNKK